MLDGALGVLKWCIMMCRACVMFLGSALGLTRAGGGEGDQERVAGWGLG